MKSADLARHFEDVFGVRPRIFSAPGRVNLIGEHTDYNDGFVMPSAIGFSAQVAIAPRSDRQLTIRSDEFPQRFNFDTASLPRQRVGAWCDYVLGVAVQLCRKGCSLGGADVLVRGEVPIGAGLSSSAAIEVASALAMMSLNGGCQLELPEVAQLCQQAENEFIGARVGVMDQFISCLGKAGHALLLDCRSLQFRLVPIPESVRLVICNTMVKHEHASGEYNRRRAECEEGVRLLSQWHPDIRALRDISPEQLERHSKDMPPTIYKRCLHVVEENERVLEGAERLAQGDLDGFGKLMGESHRSLRDLYQVSCQELDLMVELAGKLSGFRGGRMTGGGFGGCTVNLVDVATAPAFADEIAELYRQNTGIKPDIYICSAADGAGAGEPGS
jgi:galactokinase